MLDWIDQIGQFRVERCEIPRPGGAAYYPVAHSQLGVLHTTEGDTIEGAFAVLSQNRDAPHFIVGEGRILQCRPLSAQAAALHGNPPVYANKFAACQIEMVGRSSTSLWTPVPGTRGPAVAILAWAARADTLNIPLRVPVDAWQDDGSDCPLPWAANNRRRQAGVFPDQKGWYMHMEIPGQAPTWHWDCGALSRRQMLADAQAVLEGQAAWPDVTGGATGAENL